MNTFELAPTSYCTSALLRDAYLVEYHQAYLSTLALTAVHVPDKERSAAEWYWREVSYAGTEADGAALAAREDVARAHENTGHGNVFHSQLLAFQASEDLRKTRNGTATAALGVLGLAACAASLKYAPGVAMTAPEHLARAGVIVELATIGWGSVAAAGLGFMSSIFTLSDWKQKRQELNAIRRHASGEHT